MDIRVNGVLQQQNYRVKVLYWKDCRASHNRAGCIREILNYYDLNWQLYYIGMPSEDLVPITFVKNSRP